MFNPARSLLSKVSFFFVSLLILGGVLLHPHPTFAQTSSSQQLSQEDKIGITIIQVLGAISCQLVDMDPLNPSKTCSGQPFNENAPGGLLGTTSNLISVLYYQPASSTDYVNYLASNFGIAKSANAQVEQTDLITGFTVLEPLRPLWVYTRNLAYLIFVIVFIIVGMGIMLRLKIDPRSVMTIQNQLPKIVISLILITFSYAIAGFMIDMMWLTTYFGINTLTQNHNSLCLENGEVNGNPNFLADQSYRNLLDFPVAYTNAIFTDQCDGGVGDSITSQGMFSLPFKVGTSIGGIISDAAAEIIDPVYQGTDCGWRNLSDCVAEAVQEVVKVIASILGVLIIFCALLIMLFRLWWVLLKAFAYIILDVIAAPLWIAMGLLPRASTFTFGTWIRHLIAHLAVFPAAALLIVLARIIVDLYKPGPSDPKASFVPPLIGNPNLEIFGPLLAFALLLLAPELINMLRDALKTKPSAYSSAIGSGFQRGVGPAIAPIAAYGKRITRFDKQTGNAGFLRYRWMSRNPRGLTRGITNKLGLSSYKAPGYGPDKGKPQNTPSTTNP